MKTLALFLLLCGVPVFVHASLVTPDVLKSRHDAVLTADVAIESLEGVSDPRFIAKSRATARVLQIHSSVPDGRALPSVGETLLIETLGGEVGESGVLYSGYPRPYSGRSYRATLRRGAAGTFEIAGLSSGLVPLAMTRNYSRNRTDGSNGSGTGPFLYWDPEYFPIPYFLSLPNFKNQNAIADAIDASFKPWRDPGDVTLEFLPMGCTSTTVNRNDGVNTVMIITDTWEFDASAIAITRNFYVSGNGARAGLILDTDIMLNAVGYQFSTTGEATKHDVRNIVTHEVGHFIGMGHEVNPMDTSATMYESAVPGEINKRVLHTSDLQGLRTAYGGVGQKFLRYSSNEACSLGWQRLSCASAHRPSGSRAFFGWVLLAVAGALAIGRFFVRAA